MASKDYYDILGVKRAASKDEIRAAHRRLARKLHPDVNKEPDAAKKFAEVQEAYDVLSDDEKRKLYDRLGHTAYAAGAHAGGGGRGGRAGAGGPRAQTYSWSNIAGDYSDSFSQEDIGSIFEEMFGMGAPGRAGAGRARPGPKPRRGRDLEHEITIPFDLALAGGKQSLRVTRNGAPETIEITIPRGVPDGAALRLRGQGEPGRAGAQPGDLLVRIRIAPHQRYRREGLDLSADLNLSIVEATLGARVPVRMPSGEITLTIPAGTPSGSRLRVRGKGVETADGKFGDFFAVVRIVPPKNLSDEDREALRALGEKLPDPRAE